MYSNKSHRYLPDFSALPIRKIIKVAIDIFVLVVRMSMDLKTG